MSSDNAAPKEQQQQEQPDKGDVFPKDQFPGWVQAEVDRYYGTLSAEKTKYLAKLAQNEKFPIKIFKPVENLDDPDADLGPGVNPFNNPNGSDFETMEFYGHDATTNQWFIMQKLRNELMTAETIVRDKVLSSEKGGVPKQEMDTMREDVNTKDARCYYYQAKIFFRMSKELFNRCDRTQLRDACDAMTHRTIISVPNSPRGSKT